ncbi:MAG: DedA family protein [Actinobacteria bacterium]|jgi:membrane protein DedA with SNARE-associated domain|nr:DedA family protein [Actinomycetota bacterium]MCL6094440.1 DedA family protein [Actinomycetota bacterium]
MLGHLASSILHLNGLAAYVLIGALAFGEASIMLGFVIPGETAVLLGGVLASFHRVDLGMVMVISMVAAVAGDSVGYALGLLIGPWLLQHRPLKGKAAVKRADDLLAKRGGWAVLVGRYIAGARALMPGLAGIARMRYRTFFIFNAVGGVSWAAFYTTAGYLAGSSWKQVLAVAGRAEAIVVAVLVVIAVAYFVVRHRNRRRKSSSPPLGT